MKPLVILAFPTLPVLWLLVQVSDTSPAPPVLPFDNMGQVWLAIIMLIGGIVTHVMGTRREERQRVWMIEDRKAADEKAEKEAARIRLELTTEARTIKDEAWKRTDDIKSDIAENTRLTTEGIKVSNDVNNKILAVGGIKVALEGQRQAQERRPGDSAPSVGRRVTDPPPVLPTRRDEDKPEEPK